MILISLPRALAVLFAALLVLCAELAFAQTIPTPGPGFGSTGTLNAQSRLGLELGVYF